MNKKRVLYVAHGHPHRMAGGAEVYAYELYRGIREFSDFEPFFLARTSEKPHLGVPFLAIDDDPNQVLMATPGVDYFYGTSPDKLLYLLHFRNYLLHVQPDVVHFQHTLHLGFDLIRVVRNTLPNAAVVYTLHEFIPICNANGQLVRIHNKQRCTSASPSRCHECFPEISPARFFMRERFIKGHLRLVDHFHAPSNFLLERYVDWGIPRQKIAQLEYGRFVSKPVEHRSLTGSRLRNRFGFFGQLSYYKGVLVLLKAVAILHQRGFTDFSLDLNGANLEIQPEEFQTEFQSLLKDCGNLVNFSGPYQNEELPGRMAAVDWVVIPSVWWENSPLVIQESFMHRRPMLASNIGGMAEKVTHEVDGLHFHAANPVDLADTIHRAATSPDLWETLVAGIEPVFDIQDAVSAHDTLYLRLLEQSQTDQKPAIEVVHS